MSRNYSLPSHNGMTYRVHWMNETTGNSVEILVFRDREQAPEVAQRLTTDGPVYEIRFDSKGNEVKILKGEPPPGLFYPCPADCPIEKVLFTGSHAELHFRDGTSVSLRGTL